jgi:hypothetical protein
MCSGFQSGAFIYRGLVILDSTLGIQESKYENKKKLYPIDPTGIFENGIIGNFTKFIGISRFNHSDGNESQSKIIRHFPISWKSFRTLFIRVIFSILSFNELVQGKKI